MSRMAIVGCDASGKTVLISALSDYYKAGSRPGQACIMVPADSVTRRYTDNLHRVMRINRAWPEATSDIAGGSSLSWKVMREGRRLADFELLDFGGENFRYAFRDDGQVTNPEVVAKLRDYIGGADFIVITVSMDKMLRNLTPAIYRELERGDIEYDRDSEAQWVTDGLLRMVAEKVKASPPGVVVALTQADKHRKELEEFGGAKGLFERCWPTIASLYPDLNVVACASIDRMTADGMPADGYSTGGVLAVMKEFARHSFGDSDALCASLDDLRRKLGTTDETADSAGFLSALAAYRAALSELGDKTAIVGELFEARLREYGAFADGLKAREAIARRIDEARQREDAARLREQVRAEAERLEREQRESEAAVRPAESARRSPPRFGLPVLVVLAVLAAVVGLLGWRFFDLRQQEQKRAESARQARLLAEQAAKQSEAEAQRIAQENKAKEIELARVRAEKERAEAEAARQEELRKAREAEEARARAEAEKAAAQAKAREAELEKVRIEQERAVAEAEKAKAEAEAARQEEARRSAEADGGDAAATNAVGAAEETAAPQRAVAELRAEALRRRAEERELKYREFRERQRNEKELIETAGLIDSLMQSVNRAMLERGRNLIAELSGERKLTEAQAKQLAYARQFMDHLEKAQNGNSREMVWVGNQYYSAQDSLGVVKNPSEACTWYRKASSLGSAQAYYFLSLMSEQGEGCRRNEELAGRYCLKAARLGHPEAMFWTGVYFREGTHGLEKSPATACKYLKMARDAGYQNESLDGMIQQLKDADGGKTIDAFYPEDPHQEPIPRPVPKKGGSGWWRFGIR